MTSVTKASIVPDNSALVATDVKNAADVTLASNSNSDNIAEGYSSVSANDTHVKHLEDALAAGAGITITETNDGADESLTISAFSPPSISRVDDDTLVVGTGAGENQTLIDLATAANWIGGASLESASELVHVYEVMASPDTYKLSDKQPQYTAPATANRIADMQVNEAGWDGTVGTGLDETVVTYDNGTTGDAVEVGNLALIYSDAGFTLGRGRGSAAGSAVGNLSVARVNAVAGGAASGTITLEAGHEIAINDDDYIIIVDAGELIYRYDGAAWYRHIGAWFNDSGSDLLDLTVQYGNKRRYSEDSYVADEGSDYTVTNTSFEDVDATNFALEVTTNGESIMVGFAGAISHDTLGNVTYFDVEIDGQRISGDDGLLGYQTMVIDYLIPISFAIPVMGLPPGNHILSLQWKVNANEAIMFAGAGTSGKDIHPVFWAK